MSSKRRGGLGRGLGSLIPTAPVESAAQDEGRADDGVARSVDVDVRTESPTDADVPASPSDSQAGARPGNGSSARPVDRTVEIVTSHADFALANNDTGPIPVPGATFREIPIEQIHANSKQPRQVFDEDALAELTHSVREFGVLQPVVVRPAGSGDDSFELVMGERRLRAASAAGMDTIPAIIRFTGDDDMLRDALLENIHRAQLNPLEEAAAYQQLLEEFGVTHDELATRIGRSRPQVSNTIRLLNLSLAVQRRVAAGILSAGHARALLTLEDATAQDELAARIVAEGLSVRATEELAALARDGGPAKPGRRAVVPKVTAPAATELANKLSDAFDTRVRVDIGRRKGRITVEFATIADLERIVGVMAPQLESSRQDSSATNEP